MVSIPWRWFLSNSTTDSKTRKSILHSITSEWFGSLSKKKQLSTFRVLVDKRNSDAAQKVLSKLCIDASILETLLADFSKKITDVENESKGSHSKAKRVKGESETLHLPIDALTSLLEMASGGSIQITDRHTLVPVLFELLGAVVCIHHSQQLSVGVEYCKQLLLSLMFSITNECLEKSIVVDSSWLHVDHIVQCIRGTDNPQTHNASLILMASIAGMYPDAVLANIMPVFTFMGANVLRQDDNYSFHVIQRV